MSTKTQRDALKLVAAPTRGPSEMTAVPSVARVLGVADPGELSVSVNGAPPVAARMTADLGALDATSLIGREVLVLFENNDPALPMAIAVLHDVSGFAPALRPRVEKEPALEARVDGRHVVIEAEQKLELRVGKASIVIDENGKITIRGAHLYNRSTGPIRIKGGHVEIN